LAVTEVTAELRRPTLDVCPPEGRRCWSEDRRRASEDMRLIREVRARSRCESAVGAQYVTSSSESLGLLASPRPLRSARRPKATALALRSAVRSPPEGDRASAATDATRRLLWPRCWSDTRPKAHAVACRRPGNRSPTVIVRGPRRSPDAAASHGVDVFFRVYTESSSRGMGSAAPTSTLASRPGPRRLPRSCFPVLNRTRALPS